MSTGYEKSPDYRGPEPTPWGMAIGVIAFLAFVVALYLLRASIWGG